MTYAQKQINLQFTTENDTVILEGLRCAAVILNPGGSTGLATLQIRVWGLSLDHMNQFSSTGAQMVQIQNIGITVVAGDFGGLMSQVFSGTIIRAYIDTSGMPDISFTCSAVSGYYQKGIPTTPNSFPGSQNAEDMISGIAKTAGFKFTNNGAHAVLQGQYVYGSPVDQMKNIAQAAAFPLVIENNTVSIWPNDGYRDGVQIDIGPANGLVGYPSYWDAGFIVKSEFNPEIRNGRQINLTSSIQKANGSWATQNVTHELSTLDPNGPWFTTVVLAPQPYVAAN